MVAKEQSTCRYFTVSSRFRRVLLLLFMVTLLVAFLYVPRPVQYHINYIRRIVHGEIRTDYTQPHIEIQSHDAETTTRKKNFMFIKTHKCGTSSLVNVFYLLGVRRRLNFVVQKGEHQLYFGANYIKTNGRRLVPPRLNSTYNIQCQHCVFNPRIEHELMPKETSLYSTIIRSPVSQFKSAFSFFGAEGKMRKKLGNVDMDKLINHYLDLTPEPTLNTTVHSRVVNSIARDLGWAGFSETMEGSTLQEKIDAFIQHLDSEMDFVMITDRMDESLVLLKEYLGWNITDIMYLNRMVSSKPKVTMSDETKARISQYQVIDRQIFDHFNASFERHIDKIGREKVASLVKEFREMRENFENKCFNKSKTVRGPYSSITWQITDYGRNVNLACTFLQTRDVMLTHVITQLQLSQDYEVPMEGGFKMEEIITKIKHDYDNNEELV